MADLNLQFTAEATSRLAALASRRRYAVEASATEWYAAVTLSNEASSIQISFDRRDRIANVLIAQRRRESPAAAEYALWEWVDALEIANAPSTCVMLSQTAEAVSEYLTDVRDALDRHLDQMLAAGPVVIARMEAARTDRRARESDEQAQRQLALIVARASEAFWARRYGDVVELLLPVEVRLGEGDRKKLAYAARQRSAV